MHMSMENLAMGVRLGGMILLLLLLNFVELGNSFSGQTKWSVARADKCMEADLCTSRDPLMNPFYELRYGQDVVWQIPTNPKAVIFFAHGGNREPLSYFDRSPNCRQCYGLPEDRAVVLEALRRNYAVILVKSVDDGWEPKNFTTWPAPATQDRLNVASIIKEWTRKHSLEHLPLATFGQSAGGWFSSVLTLDLDIQALVLMCSSIEVSVLEHVQDAHFPPVLFVPMPADVAFYLKITNTMNAMMDKGVVVEEIDVWPRPIYPSLFADKIPCLDTNTSANIYAALKADNWLNEFDFLVLNPTIDDWKSVLRKWEAMPICQDTDDLWLAGHVEQELSCAFGVHSLTSWENGPIYDWLDSILSGDHSFSGPTSQMTASL